MLKHAYHEAAREKPGILLALVGEDVYHCNIALLSLLSRDEKTCWRAECSAQLCSMGQFETRRPTLSNGRMTPSPLPSSLATSRRRQSI